MNMWFQTVAQLCKAGGKGAGVGGAHRQGIEIILEWFIVFVGPKRDCVKGEDSELGH